MRLFTPDFVRIKTPNEKINESFDMAVVLIDELRQCSEKHYGKPGYFSVSDQKDYKCHTWDPRDYDHINKIYSYLWGMENELADAISNSIFIEQLDENDGHFKWCYKKNMKGIHIAHYSKYASDFFRYMNSDRITGEGWDRLIKFIKWSFRAFDSLGDNLIENTSDEATGEGFENGFWAYYIGEPQNFPETHSNKDKVIIASMAFCGLLKEVSKFAENHNIPEKDYLAQKYKDVLNRIEKDAYNEKRGYYYIQFDHLNKLWYFSINGACEDSRELLIIPYYVTDVVENEDRAKNVSRVVYKVLKDDFVFPMPITYPSYLWRGAGKKHNYLDFGTERFIFKGCWDNSYHNCVNLLNKCGYVQIITEAVRRRAEAACRDGDFIEWYYRDGSVGETNTAEVYHRRRYAASATAHIVSIIEGLFGIRPAGPGFNEINITPAIPYQLEKSTSKNYWVDNDIEIAVTLPGGKSLGYSFRYETARKRIIFKAIGTQVPALLRIPIFNSTGVDNIMHGKEKIDFFIERKMDTDFVFFNQILNDKETIIQLF